MNARYQVQEKLDRQAQEKAIDKMHDERALGSDNVALSLRRV